MPGCEVWFACLGFLGIICWVMFSEFGLLGEICYWTWVYWVHFTKEVLLNLVNLDDLRDSLSYVAKARDADA